MIETIILNSIFYLLLITIMVQDFKERLVTWFLFPLTFIVVFVMQLHENFLNHVLMNTLINIMLLSLILLFTILYFKLRNTTFLNFFKEKLGVGDVLFFIVPALLFSPINYVVFLSTGLLMSLFVSFFIINKKEKTIPLAGILAIILAVFHFIGVHILKLNFYHDISLIV